MPTRDEKTAVVNLPFACRCGRDDTNAERYDQLRRTVMTRIYASVGLEVADHVYESYTTQAIHELVNYEMYVDTIYADQWFLVSVASYSKEYPLNIRIQCDWVEDGLAVILDYLHERGFETS